MLPQWGHVYKRKNGPLHPCGVVAASGYNAEMPEQKEDYVKFRATTREKKEYARYAREAGLTLAGWIRMHLRLAIKEAKREEKRR